MNQCVTSTQTTPVPNDTSNALILRNARVREELRRQMREARQRQVSGRAGNKFWNIETRAIAEFRLPLMASFIALVVVPSFLAIIYFVFIASNQYVSEARFAVRASEHVGLEQLSGASMGGLAEVQDSLIVANYVQSLALVEALEQRVGLRRMFSKSSIDWLSRFNPNKPIERLERAWHNQMEPSIEKTSGIISVRVWAFSPEDSLHLAQAIVSLSEDMVNKLGERTRKDAIAQSQDELSRAEERLRKARAAMRDLRNESGVIDPTRTDEAVGKLMTGLETDLVDIEQQLDTARRTLSPDAPQFTLLEARRQAIKDNIVELKARLTTTAKPSATTSGATTFGATALGAATPGAASSDKDTLSAVMTRYDTLELERQIAERQYTAAAVALEQARVAAERKGMYLATFVKPVLAEEAAYPHRFWMSLAAIAVFCVIWLGIIAGLELLRNLSK